jgi:hypothetical protein
MLYCAKQRGQLLRAVEIRHSKTDFDCVPQRAADLT